jgi:hypothetical protein
MEDVQAMMSLNSTTDDMGRHHLTKKGKRYEQFYYLLRLDCPMDTEAFIDREIERVRERLRASERQENEFREDCTSKKQDKEKMAALEKRTAELREDYMLLAWFRNGQ